VFPYLTSIPEIGFGAATRQATKGGSVPGTRRFSRKDKKQLRSKEQT